MSLLAPPAATLPEAEAELVRWAKSGHEAAFAALVARYREPLHRYAEGIVRDGERAAELVQDLWLKVWLKLPQTTEPLYFSAWVYRILGNLCIDVMRRRKAVTEIPVSVLPLRFRVAKMGAHHQAQGDLGPSRSVEDRLNSLWCARRGHGEPEPEPPDVGVLDAEGEAEIRAILAQLPRRERRALGRLIDTGESYQALADRFGITVPSLKSVLWRARQRYRQLSGAAQD